MYYEDRLAVHNGAKDLNVLDTTFNYTDLAWNPKEKVSGTTKKIAASAGAGVRLDRDISANHKGPSSLKKSCVRVLVSRSDLITDNVLRYGDWVNIWCPVWTAICEQGKDTFHMFQLFCVRFGHEKTFACHGALSNFREPPISKDPSKNAKDEDRVLNRRHRIEHLKRTHILNPTFISYMRTLDARLLVILDLTRPLEFGLDIDLDSNGDSNADVGAMCSLSATSSTRASKKRRKNTRKLRFINCVGIEPSTLSNLPDLESLRALRVAQISRNTLQTWKIAVKLGGKWKKLVLLSIMGMSEDYKEPLEDLHRNGGFYLEQEDGLMAPVRRSSSANIGTHTGISRDHSKNIGIEITTDLGRYKASEMQSRATIVTAPQKLKLRRAPVMPGILPTSRPVSLVKASTNGSTKVSTRVSTTTHAPVQKLESHRQPRPKETQKKSQAGLQEKSQNTSQDKIRKKAGSAPEARSKRVSVDYLNRSVEDVGETERSVNGSTSREKWEKGKEDEEHGQGLGEEQEPAKRHKVRPLIEQYIRLVRADNHIRSSGEANGFLIDMRPFRTG